jgi:hypothetical protein
MMRLPVTLMTCHLPIAESRGDFQHSLNARFPPIVDTDEADHTREMKIAALILVLMLAPVISGCSPPPGKPLTSGCYYAGSVPVLRVTGVTASILIPGNIARVNVVPDTSPDQSGATFEPGFHIAAGPPLRAVRVNDLPRSSMMMEPYSGTPTIMAIAEPTGMIELARGRPC